jgi:hypothetical protein
MHTGKVKLDKTTLAIGDANGKRVAVTIPTEPTIKLPSPETDGEGRVMAMYAIDLKLRVSRLQF